MKILWWEISDAILKAGRCKERKERTSKLLQSFARSVNKKASLLATSLFALKKLAFMFHNTFHLRLLFYVRFPLGQRNAWISFRIIRTHSLLSDDDAASSLLLFMFSVVVHNCQMNMNSKQTRLTRNRKKDMKMKFIVWLHRSTTFSRICRKRLNVNRAFKKSFYRKEFYNEKHRKDSIVKVFNLRSCTIKSEVNNMLWILRETLTISLQRRQKRFCLWKPRCFLIFLHPQICFHFDRKIFV